jgi:type IV pilus assembly protein PilC
MIYRGMTPTPLDPLGVGLIGGKGALIFLGLVSGAVLGLIFTCWLLQALLGRSAFMQRLLLYLPLVGKAIQAQSVTRFALALQLLLDTRVSVLRSLRLSLQSTDNAAFIAAYPRVEAAINRGHGIATALEAPGLFPPRFLGVIAVAEESGRLPESLKFQAEEFDEQAKRRLTLISQVASGLVWLTIVLVLMLIIFRIFDTVYIRNIDKLIEQYLEGR